MASNNSMIYIVCRKSEFNIFRELDGLDRRCSSEKRLVFYLDDGFILSILLKSDYTDKFFPESRNRAFFTEINEKLPVNISTKIRSMMRSCLGQFANALTGCWQINLSIENKNTMLS
jgi:hypothetical protein